MGHFRQIDPLPTLSAGPLRSDRVRTFAAQRFDELAAYSITSSRAREQQRRHFEAERLGGLEIDYQLQLGWKLDRQITGRDATQNLLHVICTAPEACPKIDPLANQPAVIDVFPVSVNGGGAASPRSAPRFCDAR
jgi:hypothetical protein